MSATCIARRAPLRSLQAFILTEARAVHATLQPRLFSRRGSLAASFPAFLSLQESLRPLPSSASTFVAVWRCPWLALPPLQSGSLAPTNQPAFALGEPRHNQFLRRQLWLGLADSFYRSRQRSWGSFLCVCRRYAYIRCLASRLNGGGAFDFLASAQTPPEIPLSGRDL